MSNNQQYSIINFSIIFCALINKTSCFVIIFSHNIFLILHFFISKKLKKQVFLLTNVVFTYKKNKLLKKYNYMFIFGRNSDFYLFLCIKWIFIKKYVKQGGITVSWMKIMIYVYYLLSLRYTSRSLENFVD